MRYISKRQRKNRKKLKLYFLCFSFRSTWLGDFDPERLRADDHQGGALHLDEDEPEVEIDSSQTNRRLSTRRKEDEKRIEKMSNFNIGSIGGQDGR